MHRQSDRQFWDATCSQKYDSAGLVVGAVVVAVLLDWGPWSGWERRAW